jgi:hypothetical protein
MCAEISANFSIDLTRADLTKLTLVDLLKPHVGELGTSDVLRISIDRELEPEADRPKNK